jgi:DNA modification methylase
MMINHIYCGDALEILKTFDSSCIDCCITSPPYYGLRDYGTTGQIGLEQTPEQYIDKLVKAFHELKRVLKPNGTLWINISDSYAGSGKGAWKKKNKQKETYVPNPNDINIKMPKHWEGIKPKDLIGIPWMLAFALRSDGWYLRQDIIWEKPNAMPESVKDRCTKSHEYIFLLSKSRKYYFDYKAIKEPCVGSNQSLPARSKGTLTPNSRLRKGSNNDFKKMSLNTSNEKGLRNKRSVWHIATKGLKSMKAKHFATFPPELIKPCVLAGSPENGTIIDIFAGSGTTGLVAKQHNRNYILIDINKSYCELAKDRIEHCI